VPTYVTHVSAGITVKTMDDNHGTLDLRRHNTLAVRSKRLVVNESEIVVLSGRIFNSEVNEF
jgi:hypothetical protein